LIETIWLILSRYLQRINTSEEPGKSETVLCIIKSICNRMMPAENYVIETPLVKTINHSNCSLQIEKNFCYVHRAFIKN